MINNGITRARMALALATLVAASACADDNERIDILTPTPQAGVSLGVAASDLNAAAGEFITVAVEALSVQQLSGVQGFLRFDAARLRYAGQLPDHEAIVIVNESSVDRGELRLAAFSGTALTQRVAKFAFEVRATNYMNAIRFDPEVVVDLTQLELRPTVSREVTEAADLTTNAKPVHWSHTDWALYADPSLSNELNGLIANIVGLPNAGTLYGDVNMSGAINVADASDVGNTAVGNNEVIIGTASPARDRVTAANVRPTPAGACLAGFSGTNCSTRVINVADASAVAQEAVAINVAVVGDVIPLPKSSYASGDTVFLAGQTIAGTRTFRRDTLYVLNGILAVGSEGGAAGELVIQPGTRIEGDTTSAIFVTRNGRIIADGTPTQPITFTCLRPLAGRFPGCWGGLFIAGNAVINEQDASLAGVTAPAIPGRNPVGGQNQRAGEGGAINHGGGNDADSSGVIRYAIFAYGGQDLGNNNELNNLTIGSCGSGTILDHIQVHGGEDDGLELFGGRCNVRYLYATGNDDDQFDYSFGYDGKVQFVLLQHCKVAINDCDKQFEVDNTETAATYNNTPRVNPVVYNVTSVGGSQGTGTQHIHYRRGAGGTLRNMLVVGGATGWIVDNAETCGTNSGLSFNNTVILGPLATLLGGGAGCAPATVAIGTNVDTATYVAQLKDPVSVTLPDFRPVGNGISSSLFTPATPPADGYFDTSATYYGAVAPVGVNPASIPWYAGWTIGWQSPTTR